MELEVVGNTNLHIDAHDGGLRINSGHNKGILMLFGFDGKYQRNKKNYNIYKHPVRVTKYCKQCKNNSFQSPKQLTFKSRSVGTTILNNFTTLNNMEIKVCSYTFMIFGDSEGNYDGNMLWEEVRYHDEKSFWHVDNSYTTHTSVLTHSSFEASLSDVMILNIPALVNLNSIENIDQFLSKYKMYMMMS